MERYDPERARGAEWQRLKEVEQRPEANRAVEHEPPREVQPLGSPSDDPNNKQIEAVPLENIEPSRMKSLDDFRDNSMPNKVERYEYLKRDLQLMGRIGPVVERGGVTPQTQEVFRSWDQQAKVGDYTPEGQVRLRGYEDTYKSNVVDHPVRLDANNDGTFRIDDGNHRVFVAQSEGISPIYARVYRPS